MMVVLHLVKDGGMSKAKCKTGQWSPSHLNYQQGSNPLYFGSSDGSRMTAAYGIHLKQDDKVKLTLVLFHSFISLVNTYTYPKSQTNIKNQSISLDRV